MNKMKKKMATEICYYSLFCNASDGKEKIKKILEEQGIENPYDDLVVGSLDKKKDLSKPSYITSYMPVNLGLLLDTSKNRINPLSYEEKYKIYCDTLKLYDDIKLYDIKGITIPTQNLTLNNANFVSFFDNKMKIFSNSDEFMQGYKDSKLANLTEKQRIEYMKEYIFNLKELLKQYQSDLPIYDVTSEKKLTLRKL